MGAGRAGTWASGRRALGRVTRRRTACGQTRGALGRGAQGERHERQARRRTRGYTAMLACDTAEGLLRHGASARSARGHARPGRGLGAGWVCWLGQVG